ncbi:MAG: cytochrome b/b6 domain-containing protein [Candidatus Zixiibacteriota bacterium]
MTKRLLTLLTPTILLIFLVVPKAFAQSVENCMMCHADESLTKEDSTGKEISLFVDQSAFEQSVHGMFSCTGCHLGVKAEYHETSLEPASCGMCHAEADKLYQAGYHARKRREGVADAPICGDCHGYHNIRGVDDEEDQAYRGNQPKMCGQCHGREKNVCRKSDKCPGPYGDYMESAHGKALQEENLGVAVCTDCHRSHDLKFQSDPASYAHRSNVPSTCGQCHLEEEEYSEDVHGTAVERGDPDAPVCTDCHTAHAIKSSSDPTSSTFGANVSKLTCTYCHSRERIYEKYGYVTRRVTPYLDTYHGVGSRSGDTTTASCVSCHTSHNVRSQDDPLSTINQANIPQTCGQCHKGAGPNYAKGSVHIVSTSKKDIGVYWVRRIYLLMIVLTIGGMLAHNAVIMLRFARQRYREAKSGRVIRWTALEVMWHFLLVLSFVVLIITGFAFRFPDAWWSSWMTHSSTAFVARGVAHRVAAVVFIGLFIFALFRSGLTKRGWRQINAKFPVLSDTRNVIQNILYSLGLSSKHPEFDRYDYAEKAEYWALMWGGFVMIITGFPLWFETFFLGFIPKWLLDVAKAIHYYEAMLATLAIVVWHFFYMFIHPENYPINFTVLTGTMTEEEYMEKHPLDYEKMIARGELIGEEPEEGPDETKES